MAIIQSGTANSASLKVDSNKAVRLNFSPAGISTPIFQATSSLLTISAGATAGTALGGIGNPTINNKKLVKVVSATLNIRCSTGFSTPVVANRALGLYMKTGATGVVGSPTTGSTAGVRGGGSIVLANLGFPTNNPAGGSFTAPCAIFNLQHLGAANAEKTLTYTWGGPHAPQTAPITLRAGEILLWRVVNNFDATGAYDAYMTFQWYEEDI